MIPTLLPRDRRRDWQEMLSPPEVGHTTLAALMLFISALALPLSQRPNICLGFGFLALCLFYWLTRSFLGLVLYFAPAVLLTGVSAMLPQLGNELTLPVAYVALLMGGAGGAFLFLHYHGKKHWYVFALPLLAVGVSYLLTGELYRSLLALLPFVPAALLAACIWLCIPHTDSVVAGSVALALALAVAGLITLLITGELAPDLLARLADTLRASIVEFYANALAASAELGATLPLSDVDIANMAALFVNLLPGLFAVCCTVLTFLTFRMLLGLLVTFRTVPRLPMRLSVLTVSLPCAVLFVLAYILSLLSNSEGVTRFGMVCENLSLVLEPALALVGFRVLFSMKERRSCLSLLLTLGILALLFLSPGAGLALAAFCGAFHVIAARFLPSSNEKGE